MGAAQVIVCDALQSRYSSWFSSSVDTILACHVEARLYLQRRLYWSTCRQDTDAMACQVSDFPPETVASCEMVTLPVVVQLLKL